MKTALGLPGRVNAPVALLCGLALICAACGGEAADDDDGRDEAPAAAGGLTPEQLVNGVGPITEVEVGPIDEGLAATGEETFVIKCSACHKLDERYVGPPLRGVTERRSPAFIMNMILNPEGMLAQHPEVQALLAQFAVPMANQNLTQADARAVLEYLRSAAEGEEGT